MFGSGVPVLAVDFPALAELVHHGENGLVFRSKEELTSLVLRLLFSDEEGARLDELARLRDGVRKIAGWDEHWGDTLKPLLESVFARLRPAE